MKNYLHIKEILLDMSNQYIYRTNILISIGHIGIPFTWYNKKEAIGSSICKTRSSLREYPLAKPVPDRCSKQSPILGSHTYSIKSHTNTFTK